MEEQKASAEGMAGEHTLAMTRCSELSLTGVREVRSFDENEVKMDTSCGILLIRGEGLHVKSLVLEKGEARVEGTVESLQYQEEKGFGKKGESVFSRLFG